MLLSSVIGVGTGVDRHAQHQRSFVLHQPALALRCAWRQLLRCPVLPPTPVERPDVILAILARRVFSGSLLVTGLMAWQAVAAQPSRRAPILDMHMHAREAAHYGPTGLPLCAPIERSMPRWDQRKPLGADDTTPPSCATPLVSPLTDLAVGEQTFAAMQRHNVFGVLGGQPELVATWMRAAPGRFIPALDLRFVRETGVARAATPDGAPVRMLPPDSVRALHARGAFRVLAEVMNQYVGIAPDDPRLEPYWSLAEELDLPVGIHVGGGEPGQPYARGSGFRARLQSALTLEEVLVRHPRMRVYIMHAGYPLLDDLLALLFSYPQVYVELSMADNVERRPAFHRFLRGIIDAGYGDRVMFGSDSMIWPGLIDAAVRGIDEASFLTVAQKRDIFYNNAARFLRLTDADIARHHGRR